MMAEGEDVAAETETCLHYTSSLHFCWRFGNCSGVYHRLN